MGRFRISAALVAAVLAAGSFAGMSAAHGAVSAKVPSDPCAVITEADLSGLSTSYTISSTSSELEGNCTYYLDDGSGSSPLQLFVESSIGFKAQKAATSKVKKLAGLPGGYIGQFQGGALAVAYLAGKTGIRLTDGDLSKADLVALLKAVYKHAH
jgi:hypothetical protein